MQKKPSRTSNDAYSGRGGRRTKRSRGPVDPAEYAERISQYLVTPRKDAKRYRYSNLQGEDRVEMMRMIADCARAAMTNFEMAQYFGVTEQTLNDWFIKDPDFALVMRANRMMADDRVERALYARAVGYSYKAQEVKITNEGKIYKTDVIKHVPPDITAITFWLKNRAPQQWKDKIDVNNSVEGTVTIEHKEDDPRALAMAVLDVLQNSVYARNNLTIDAAAEPAKSIEDYTQEELEQMDVDEIERLTRGD